VISQSELNGYTTSSNLTYPDNTLLKSPDSSSVYLYYQGTRKVFFNEKYFLANSFEWKNIIVIPQAELTQYQLGSMVGYPDGTLIKGLDPEVYLIKAGQRRPIENETVFKQLSFSWHDILTITDPELTIYPIGDKITSANYILFK